ncbi:MAG TPA: arsenosugar biosynthesis radical SAM (seleno)protein ArsS [Planctomycetota bacterium]
MTPESASPARPARPLQVLPTLQRRQAPLADAARQRATVAAVPLADPLGGDFDRHLERAGLHPLTAAGIEVLQLNLGRVCNQTCAHCHVDAGPDRVEDMSVETAEACLRILAASAIPTVDITGGAPEMSRVFRRVVTEARRLGRRVLDRCNLTILLAKRYEDLPAFLAEHEVEVVCSLPHYRPFGTDRQRGAGVFEASLEGLRRLNAVGYGRDPRLRLVLVTNPVGAFLPPGQRALELEWKREMRRLWGIEFDALYTITNMPISRYLEWLVESGNLAPYLQRLVTAFNPAAAAGVMCRTTLSVGWDGRLFDCDFNQMLELGTGFGAPATIHDFDPARLAGRRIVTGRHCFGCTAGAGSSCGGSVAE